MTSEGLSGNARRAFGALTPVRAAMSRIAHASRRSRLHALLPFAVLGAWAVVIRSVNLRHMTDIGLVSVLPAGVILLLFLLTASFCLSLKRRPLRPALPLVHVVVLVVMLYGITSFLEPEPRFAVAWRLAGIMNSFASHQVIGPKFDAFFDWPAFLAFGALLTRAAGFHSTVAIAGWGPIFFNLLFLPPLVMIFRWASDDRRVTWLGLWIFYSTNWVGQDYVSNQAVAYALWLAILAALLTWFTPRPSKLIGPRLRGLARMLGPRVLWANWRRQGDRVVAAGAAYQGVLLFVLIVTIYGAVVAGHQLTPVPALLAVTGLTVFAGLQTRLLPVIMGVLVAAWVSYMTTSFLAGHFSYVVGTVGQVSQNLNQSVSSRVTGSTGHHVVTEIRTFATIFVWLLAAAGVVRRLVAGYADIGMVVVAAAAFLLPGLQAYGGEVVLRVVLFSLPAVSFLLATLAFPSPSSGRNWPTLTAVAIISCVLLVLFQYTRYGNERADYYTKGDVATVQAFYRLAPVGSTVYAGNENLPWRYRNYHSYNYKTLFPLPANVSPNNAKQIASQLRTDLAPTGGYVLLTRSNKIEEAIFDGLPHVLDRLVGVLRRDRGFREVYRSRDGDIFYLASRAHARVK